MSKPLDAARGFINGFLLVMPFWLVVCAVLAWVLR